MHWRQLLTLKSESRKCGELGAARPGFGGRKPRGKDLTTREEEEGQEEEEEEEEDEDDQLDEEEEDTHKEDEQ